MKRLTNPRLYTSKENVLSDKIKHGLFVVAHQCVKKTYANLGSQDKNVWAIAGLGEKVAPVINITRGVGKVCKVVDIARASKVRWNMEI